MGPEAVRRAREALGARAGRAPEALSGGGFDFPSLAGLLVEISSDGPGAALTAAVDLVLDAQRRGEWAAWVAAGDSSFFPPDAAAAGVDLDAVAVARVPGAPAALRAADLLARSGAFGLLVLDLGADPRVPPAAAARLAGLARRHAAVALCLTEKPARAASLGPLVAVRAEALRERLPGGGFRVRVRGLRDRRGAAGWTVDRECGGPEGLA
jgi:recombination protein RecA